MENDNVKCKKCEKNFIIENEDFAFYTRLQVPPPTLCPQCRFQRRMSWRNGWDLFKRKDDHDGKDIFSLFPQESPVKVYDRDFWWSDGWDPMEYSRDYDPSRSFFEQFRDLLYAVPLPSHSAFNLTNCHYCTNLGDCKNCYLVRGAINTEDSAYLIWDYGSKQCMDSHMTTKCELCYGCVNTENCYKTFFSVDCTDCQEMIFSKDCVGCNNCFGCFGLRSKSYCIFNEQYTKEEYQRKLQEMDIASHANFERYRAQAYEHWQKYPHKFMHGLRNINSSGDYVYESKNAKLCYRGHGMEDCKYVQNILSQSAKDSYDHSNYGEGTELCYEDLIVGRGGYNIKFSSHTYINVKNIEYGFFCHSSSDLFGCVGLRNKQYCILNRQYDKQSFDELRTRIIARMREDGEYGEFMPSSMSYFPYPITEAHEFFPLTNEQANERGFRVFDLPKQIYTTTILAQDIPDDIKNATEDILQAVIECSHQEQCAQECTGAFRIIPEELIFLRRMNIPLPRLCPNCRHYERLALRNSPVFYKRQCGKCGGEVETSYSPDRPEVIYCESCYQHEVV